MFTERDMLQVLGNAFVSGSLNDLLPLLTEDCVYHSDLSGITSKGKNAIIERWAAVNARMLKRVPYFFEIAPSDQLVRDRDTAPSVFLGVYCIKLAYKTSDNLIALVFIRIDEDSLISEMNVSRNPQYVLINTLLKDSPLTVQPIAPSDLDVETVTVEEMLRAFYSEENVAKIMKERQKYSEQSVYVWRQADRFMQKWLPDNGYRIVKSEIELDCIGYRCKRSGQNYTIFIIASGELITTLLDGDFCKRLLELPISKNSAVLVAFLKVEKEANEGNYRVMNFSGKDKAIELWEPQILNGKNILCFFPRKEMTDAMIDFVSAFNEQNLDVLQALLSARAGVDLLEKPGGRLLNEAVYYHLSSLFEKYGKMKMGYVNHNHTEEIYSKVPYLEEFGFFSLSFDDHDKIQLITESSFENEHHDFIFTGDAIPESRLKQTPDIAAVEFLCPETTQKYAMKLTFQNGEVKKFSGDIANRRYIFTDKIFANGLLTETRIAPQDRAFKNYPPCGQGVEFANGFSIGKTQLYRESVPFYEGKSLNEVVFDDENYTLTQICEWKGSKLHFDKEAKLFRVLLTGGSYFNVRCFATFALSDGKRATNLEFDYMSSFQDGLFRVAVVGYGYGYVDKNLDFVILPQFNRSQDFKEGFASVSLSENGKERWFVIDKTGKEIIFRKPNGETIEGKYKILCDYSEGMMRVSTIGQPYLAYHSDNEKYAGIWGYVDRLGVEIVSPRYIYAMDFQDGLAEVCKGEWTVDKKWDNEHRTGAVWSEEEFWGMIDGIGREVVPCVFDELKRFWSDREDYGIDPDYFAAHFGGWADGKWGIIDRTGKWVVEPIFEDIGYDISRDGCFQYYGANKWSVNDDEPIMGVYSIPENKVVLEPLFVDVDFLDDGLFRVELPHSTEPNKTITKIIDRNGNVLFPSEYTFIYEHGDFYEVTIREKDKPDRDGLVDKAGNIVLPCKYDISFNGISVEKRRFIFQKSGKQGIMDFDENIIVPAIYDEIFRPSSGFLVVTTGEKDHRLRGLILSDGQQVLPVVYDSIDIDGERITARNKDGSYIFRLIKKHGA